MTRAGREPAEDVKRAFRQAIEFTGLKLHEVHMHKMDHIQGRVVHATAFPEDWPHELPAIEMLTTVGLDGTVGGKRGQVQLFAVGLVKTGPVRNLFSCAFLWTPAL